jgi:tetratricopeptide (TPR) repeat protein
MQTTLGGCFEMTEPLTDLNINNLDPQHFVFWQPVVGHTIHVGPDQQAVPLPQIPLPVKLKDMSDEGPVDNAVGEGIYDYLRQFPDCLHNTDYVALLRQGYAHYLADLAAHVVMLDKKEVDPAYVFRKLTYLKILRLLEPDNAGLLWQLSQGFFDLGMTFTELPQVRRHLLDAMRFGQELLKVKKNDPAALNLLAEIDILFGDYPAAITKLRRLLESLSDQQVKKRVAFRLDSCIELGLPDHPLVDDLECIGEAMQLYAAKEYFLATELLERLEEDGYFVSELKSADFLCLLGMCRIKTEDRSGAFDALSQALEMAPDHEQAREAIESI